MRKKLSIGLLIALLVAGLAFSGLALAQEPVNIETEKPYGEFIDADGDGVCDFCGEYGFGRGACDGTCEDPIQQRLRDGSGTGNTYGHGAGERPFSECDGTCDNPIQQRAQDGTGRGAGRGGRWNR